jgi:hypothetical protein
MYNLRSELIKAVMGSLKIDNNPFNQQIIADKISHIQDGQLQDFYGKLFSLSHQFLNGLDRVSKVAETYIPLEKDNLKEEAEKICGKPQRPDFEEDIVAAIKWVDGTIIDVVREVKRKA